MSREQLITRSKRRLKLGLPVKEGEGKGVVVAQIRKLEVKIMKEKLRERKKHNSGKKYLELILGRNK